MPIKITFKTYQNTAYLSCSFFFFSCLCLFFFFFCYLWSVCLFVCLFVNVRWNIANMLILFSAWFQIYEAQSKISYHRVCLNYSWVVLRMLPHPPLKEGKLRKVVQIYFIRAKREHLYIHFPLCFTFSSTIHTKVWALWLNKTFILNQQTNFLRI